MSTTIGRALRAAVRCLEARDISEPRASAEVLLADLLALPRSYLHLEARSPLNASQEDLYRARIKRRLQREPVQYITGQQEFWSLRFEVNHHVLIPRPESELLVEHGVRFAQEWHATHYQFPLYVLDVGTGSGNLAISLTRMLPHSRACGIDISSRALAVSRRNASRLGVANRLNWIRGDLVTPFQDCSPHFALCVSNLPYVTREEWQQLPCEIRDYEPPQALLGGSRGLNLIQRLIVDSHRVLAPGATLLLEVGQGQAKAVVDIIAQYHHFQSSGIYQDFAGIDRVVWAQLP